MKKVWTEVELAILRRDYPTLGAMGLAPVLGRTVLSVRMMAGRQGLRYTERSNAQKQRIAKNGHPRGAKGLKHTPEHLQKMTRAARTKLMLATSEERQARRDKIVNTKIAKYGVGGGAIGAANPYSRCKSGRREDLDNRFFRSMWEANYARYLRFLLGLGEIKAWDYEVDTFIFHGVTRAPVCYKPDFKVEYPNGDVEYHEVKGWMDSKSRSKLKRMKKFYPDVKLLVIGEKAYAEISRKLGGAIPGWERKAS